MRIAYGDDPEQHGDLHLPQGEGPYATVVMVHGGFWLARYDASLTTPLAEDLAGRGYAVWNVEYRRVGNGGGWPATLQDVAASADHVAALAEDRPLDPGRVVAIGHSAGAQLAAWLAARPDLPDGAPGAHPQVAVRALVSQGGILDLRAAAEQRLGGGSTQRFLGGGPDEVPGRYDLASPVERVPVGVPLVAVHGEEDDLVPPSQTESYVQAARLAGDDATAVIVEHEGHFDHLDPTSEVWAAAVGAIDRLVRPGGPETVEWQLS